MELIPFIVKSLLWRNSSIQKVRWLICQLLAVHICPYQHLPLKRELLNGKRDLRMFNLNKWTTKRHFPKLKQMISYIVILPTVLVKAYYMGHKASNELSYLTKLTRQNQEVLNRIKHRWAKEIRRNNLRSLNS